METIDLYRDQLNLVGQTGSGVWIGVSIGLDQRHRHVHGILAGNRTDQRVRTRQCLVRLFLNALQGNKSKEFWVFDTAEDSWAALPRTAYDVDAGGSLEYMNGTFYALRGGDKGDFGEY